MGLIQENNDDIISGINVTPLVDIMLVLLIIFMLVSSVVDFQAIKVELPQAATGEDIKNETVSVTKSQNGEYYLAGKKTDSLLVPVAIVKKNSTSQTCGKEGRAETGHQKREKAGSRDRKNKNKSGTGIA